MAFSLVTGSYSRRPLGNRWEITCLVDDVTSTGSNVTAATLGLTGSIDSLVATAIGATVAIQAAKNSTTGSDSSAGSIFLKSASTTTDVEVRLVGRG